MKIPDRPITLQQATEAEYSALNGLVGEERERQWTRWREAAAKSQAAITTDATDAKLNRAALEAAVEAAVRHLSAGE
ncbi:hypothetical protein [Streptomyces sp. NEAU-YJ-81]|uniref:hypothetical protein n=1 Tax=Streptomyces sp. NEAU-YJ-81 TaxID=2820288 RepID=UPI0027E1650A|nr:hypothetical protein [Streptomyces sp. NEAU-YJ-81]